MVKRTDVYGKETYGIVALIISFIFIWTFVIAGINITFDLVEPNVMINLICIGCSLALVLMSYFIRTKETVYWITSYSYKDAFMMTDEKRSRISLLFYKIMGGTNVLLVLYLTISIFIGFGILIDFIIYFTGILISSIYVVVKLKSIE